MEGEHYRVQKRTDSTPSRTQGSKDFVEHLRTVHFALIAVSAVLLSVSAKSYNTPNALREINEIIKLQRVWSPDWVAEHCKSSLKNNGPDDLPKNALDPDGQIPGFVQWFGKPTTPSRYMFVLPPERWGGWQKGWAPASEEAWSAPPQFEKAPNTLSGFRSWWNGMATTHEFVIPEGVSMSGSVSNQPGKESGIAQLGSEVNAPSLERVELYVGYDFDEARSAIAGPSGRNPGIPRGTLPFAFQAALPKRELWPIAVGGADFVSFQVSSYREAEVNQSELTRTFTNWRIGVFEKSFGDLALAAHGLEDVDLEDVRKEISDESLKGEATFEAFGMKFPADQVSFLGTIILLSVQFYLFVYMKQLREKLRPDDSGWEVPWVGMGTSREARGTFFTTLVILPCLALFVLTWKTVSPLLWENPKTWDVGIFERVVFLLVALFVSGIIAKRSWEQRPRQAAAS